MPFERAVMLEETYRIAFNIILGQFKGLKWDWKKMAWEPPKKRPTGPRGRKGGR